MHRMLQLWQLSRSEVQRAASLLGQPDVDEDPVPLYVFSSTLECSYGHMVARSCGRPAGRRDGGRGDQLDALVSSMAGASMVCCQDVFRLPSDRGTEWNWSALSPLAMLPHQTVPPGHGLGSMDIHDRRLVVRKEDVVKVC